MKPVPVVEHLVVEIARLLAAELEVWPPRIEGFDEVTGGKAARLVAEHPLRPDPRYWRQAFALTRLELSRELEAFDAHVRNQRWLEEGLVPDDRAMILFLTRLVTEPLFALAEATEGRLNRARLLEIAARVERHLLTEKTP